MSNYLLPNSNKVLTEPVACWFSFGCSLTVLKASRTCRWLKFVMCFCYGCVSNLCCNVSFHLWTSLKCFLIAPDWRCIVRWLDRVVVAIPIYLAWARSSLSFFAFKFVNNIGHLENINTWAVLHNELCGYIWIVVNN